MPDPSLPERAKVEVMAIQALCRWPRLSGEIGVQADFFRTDKKLAALAEALDKAQVLNSDGSVQLLDLATRARVDWQWLRQQFGATFLHVDQGRGWVEQLAQAEAELRLRIEVEGVFKERHGPGLLEALADVVARHQSAPVANGSNGPKDIASLTARYIDDRMEALATGRSSAVPTGMPTLDRFFKGGWRRKEVTILLAGAGVGKTTFADHLRRLLAQKGWSSLLFSAEMSEEQLAERQAHASAAVELDRELDMDDLREASGRIRGDQAWLRHLEVDEAPTITPGRMIARARARIAAGVPLALLVADTLGKVRVHDRREGGRNGSGGGGRRQRVQPADLGAARDEAGGEGGADGGSRHPPPEGGGGRAVPPRCPRDAARRARGGQRDRAVERGAHHEAAHHEGPPNPGNRALRCGSGVRPGHPALHGGQPLGPAADDERQDRADARRTRGGDTVKKSEFREERERHLREFEGLTTPTVIHLRLERAVEDAEAAGVEWDPEEEARRPRRVRIDGVDRTYLVAEFDKPGRGEFWAHLDFEGDWNISLEARRAIAEEVLAAYNREGEAVAPAGEVKEHGLPERLKTVIEGMGAFVRPEGRPFSGMDEQIRSLDAACHAYNREREEEAFDAEHGAEFNAAVEEVCRGEVDALVAEKVQEERDRCERLVFALKLHFAGSLKDLIEQYRLAIEQGTTHEQDLPPFPPDYKARSEESEGALHRLAREAGVPDDGPAEIVGAVLEELRRLRCYEALSPQTIQRERDRCLGILDKLVNQLQSPFPYHAAKRARSRVASGAPAEFRWSGSDDPPNPEPFPDRQWPTSWDAIPDVEGAHAYYLNDDALEETRRRWEAEPKLQAEVERLKGFAAFPLSEEVARLRAKIEQAISVIRAGFPSETRALDEGGKTHGFQWTAFAVYRILTGKES